MRTHYLSLAMLLACTARAEPPGETRLNAVVGSTSYLSSAAPSSSASLSSTKAVEVSVILAGDAIPQNRVLKNKIVDIFSMIPDYYTKADIRIVNLEAPIGSRDDLPSDKSLLYFASPIEWVKDLVSDGKTSAFVIANNHSCDLGEVGLNHTVSELRKEHIEFAGVDETDPWKPARITVKDRTICIVSWTTFLNDKGEKAKRCIDGEAGYRVAIAEVGTKTLAQVHRELSAPHRWDACDGRIAYIHGGREYHWQISPVLDQATAATAYVDAVVISHPHVPDGVSLVKSVAPRMVDVPGRPVGRMVPVFRSLGNFVSNQGVGWTQGMNASIIENNGSPDPLRIVWTRVSVLATLKFTFTSKNYPQVKYGYGLLFTERSGSNHDEIRLRALSDHNEPLFKKLLDGPNPFNTLLSDPCLRTENDNTPCSTGD